jgi:tripartite-type tricarboxylate transporter receptor subunit TctC
VAPARTPREILEFWNREIVKVLKDPQVSAELAKHGLDPRPARARSSRANMERESEKWGKVVREAKITPE